jgi:hypothetical protein
MSFRGFPATLSTFFENALPRGLPFVANAVGFVAHLKEGKCKRYMVLFRQLNKEMGMMKFLRDSRNWVTVNHASRTRLPQNRN